jgi:UDP-N-acetylmuramate dehydrogenase
MPDKTKKRDTPPEPDRRSILSLLSENSLLGIRKNESMSAHTSFKIGGPCKVFIAPETERHVRMTLKWCSENEFALVVIGNGTNVLVQDKGFKGVIIRISEPYFSSTRSHGSMIEVGAGLSISRLLDLLIQKGLSGFEFMAGIPGTVAGAIAMNAGAQGKRISDAVTRVWVMSRQSETYWVANEEIEFGYKKSRFRNSGEIILKAELGLKKGNSDKIAEEISRISKEREKKLPLDMPSAGCIFKNPQDEPAGKLIEIAGCKGLRVGDAQVSNKHANFIVNLGAATCEDVQALMSKVQKRVYEKSEISLEPEIVCI